MLDSGGATAHAVREFKVSTAPLCDSVAARGIAQRAGLGEVKALAEKANQVGVFDGEQGRLGTKVPPVAKLNALRAACGIVVPGEPACESGHAHNADAAVASNCATDFSNVLGSF